ncbi:MAG: hypothetical protein A2Z03_06560 [Chloroflexi bacterium RBG_16_56_8]|nr:MAG: hypothetical protein A2Z03_06560 [Chloroflexi bacterium RBG_16_56_8]
MAHPRPDRFFSMIFIGTGLIALGAVLFMAVAPKADAQEYSTVPVEIEFPAPSLVLRDLQGNSASLEERRGSVVLVNLWATWCPPCKAEMPALQAFYEKYRDDGFVIIGINDGEPLELVASFAGEYGLTFPIWLDEAYRTERAFGTISLPSSYVIDRQGIVRLMWIGAISNKNLEKYVTPMIKE